MKIIIGLTCAFSLVITYFKRIITQSAASIGGKSQSDIRVEVQPKDLIESMDPDNFQTQHPHLIATSFDMSR